jgi:hypothetical protein
MVGRRVATYLYMLTNTSRTVDDDQPGLTYSAPS